MPASQAAWQAEFLTQSGVPVAVQSATHLSLQGVDGDEVSVDSLRQKGEEGRTPSFGFRLFTQL